MSFRYVCEFYLFSDVTLLKSLQFVHRVEIGFNLRILVSVRGETIQSCEQGRF